MKDAPFKKVYLGPLMKYEKRLSFLQRMEAFLNELTPERKKELFADDYLEELVYQISMEKIKRDQ